MANPDEFKEERERLNDLVMRYANRDIKRFYNLDSAVYKDGELSSKTKEMLGLVSSMVLRCDDCIEYHIIRCYEEGVTDGEFAEAVSIGLVVGGSIVIPHLRRAVDFWDKLKREGNGED